MTTYVEVWEKWTWSRPKVMIHGQQGPSTEGRLRRPVGERHGMDPETGRTLCNRDTQNWFQAGEFRVGFGEICEECRTKAGM